MGCLVQRYLNELKKAIPEVDLFIPIDNYKDFWQEIKKVVNNKDNNINNNCIKLDYLNRVISTGNKTAYLKIAEGCNNNCTYCAIPYIRGKYVSRPLEDVLEEAQKLAKSGIEEVILIAQDTTRYGEDLYGKKMLAELLDRISRIDGFKWIRFLYAYPESIDDNLIEIVKRNDKICNYFDIPIQHISDSVLKRMNRRTTGKQIEDLINRIKEEIPDVILRTSLIVGFPGETEEDFSRLCEFVKKGYFQKLGVFMYSKEDGTPAARIKEQIHHNTKKKRYKEVMSIAKEISKKNLENNIGKIYNVLIENITFDNKYYIGRSYMDIPETDGLIFIKSTRNNCIGKFINCRITSVKDYDLIGEID